MAAPMRVAVEWDGAKITEETRAAGVRGIKHGTEHLLTESRREVPLEEGTLERSGVATVDEDRLTGAVSYGTKYAARQHEEMGWRHKAGRKAKYLEDPLNREAGNIQALIAAQIRRSLRG